MFRQMSSINTQLGNSCRHTISNNGHWKCNKYWDTAETIRKDAHKYAGTDHQAIRIETRLTTRNSQSVRA